MASAKILRLGDHPRFQPVDEAPAGAPPDDPEGFLLLVGQGTPGQ